MTYTYNATMIPRFLCGLVIKDEITADVFTTACLLAQPGWDTRSLPPHLIEFGEEAAQLLSGAKPSQTRTRPPSQTPQTNISSLASYLESRLLNVFPDHPSFTSSQLNQIAQRAGSQEVIDGVLTVAEHAAQKTPIANLPGYLYAALTRSTGEQIIKQALATRTTPKRQTYMERVKQEMEKLTPLPELVGADG